MKAKALVSFAGAVSAGIGDFVEIADKAVYEDLIRAGYIASLEDSPAPAKRTARKAKNKELDS